MPVITKDELIFALQIVKHTINTSEYGIVTDIEVTQQSIQQRTNTAMKRNM